MSDTVPVEFLDKWDKVFKNGPSKICGRQSLKRFKGYGLLKQMYRIPNVQFPKKQEVKLILSRSLTKRFRSIVHQRQRRIQNPVNYLEWSAARKL